MKHKWVTLVTMQPEIRHQNSQHFYPSEPFQKNHITMRHPVCRRFPSARPKTFYIHGKPPNLFTTYLFSYFFVLVKVQTDLLFPLTFYCFFYIPKGQLISKCLFGVFTSSKTQTKKFNLLQIVFVRFLEELKTFRN